jgi:ADP-heptose:LPS heptosyltransferase
MPPDSMTAGAAVSPGAENARGQSGTGALVSDVTKIAVLRANRLGDFVVTLPALTALRAAYPAAEIVLLGLAWHAEFMVGRAQPIDRVVVIPPCRGVGEAEDFVADPAALADFFATLAAESFDLALQLHGGGRFSNPFIRRLGARLTAGLRTPEAAPLDRWIPYLPYQHEILRFLEVVGLVGGGPVPLAPQLAVTADDLAAAAQALPDDGRPLVAIHPSATDPRRRWPPAHFAVVGDALAAVGARVALVGTAEESTLTAAVRSAMIAPSVDLAGKLTLGGLAGVLARCRVVIGNDSGPLHLAAAVGVPTVGLYWGPNLIHYGPLMRARHRPFVSWQGAVLDGGDPIAMTASDPTASLVADLPPAAVAAAAMELYMSHAADTLRR